MTLYDCNYVILSKQKNFNIDIINDIIELLNFDSFITIHDTLV